MRVVRKKIVARRKKARGEVLETELRVLVKARLSVRR